MAGSVDGVPAWDRDPAQFDAEIVRTLPGPDDPEGMTTSELARRLKVTPYWQDIRLRPRLNQLAKTGQVERMRQVRRGWYHRWRRGRS
jgi:hypothetical protein